MAKRPPDYRDFREPGQKPASDNNDPRTNKWWLARPEDLGASINQVLQTLAQYDRARIENYVTNSRLYGNLPAYPWMGIGSARITPQNNVIRDRISFNVIQNCVDTLRSRIIKNKPKPLFLTSQGDWKLQRKAKKLQQFIDGIFYENSVYELSPILFRDAEVWGDGGCFVYAKDGRIAYERVLPHELFVDTYETAYGPAAARSLHRVKNIDRDVLIEMFPDKRDVIAQLTSSNDLIGGHARSVSDILTVTESWHLPSGKDAEDGMHVISCEDAVLFSEPYEKDFFPFAFIRYNPRLVGFWSQSLAEILTPIQVELNRLMIVIQRSMHLAGTFKILIKAGSKIVKSHLNRDIGSIVEWAGDTPPAYITPPIVPQEIYNHIETLKAMAYEQSGISQLQAASLKPAGLDSGKALREYDDINSDRFQFVGQNYENFFLDLARISISVAKDIYEEQGELSVTVPSKKYIQKIDWKDVSLDADDFVMQMFPVSKLASDPSERLDDIQELMQAGIIDPETGRRLLDFPDLDAEENLANAQQDYLHKILDGIVEDGEYTPPAPDDNLVMARKLALEYLAVGKRDNVPDEGLELLRRFIDQVTVLQQKALPPAPPQAAGQPQAKPEAPPTSDLLPNVPGSQGA